MTVNEMSESAVNPVEYIIKAVVFATYAQAVNCHNFEIKAILPPERVAWTRKSF